MGVVKYGAQDEAKELAYDNSTSGLAASTIQQAIDLLQSTKEPANSNILKTTNIGVTVQAYNSNLTDINQGLTTTSSPTFNALTLTSLSVNSGNFSVSSGGVVGGTGFNTAVTTIASGLITTHAGLADPHPGYLTTAEGDAAYSTLVHGHSNVVAGGASGYMTGTDKTKLDGIATGATAYTDEAAQDAVATAIAAGTHSGVTVAYNDASNSLDFTSVVKNIYAANVTSTSGTSTITPGTTAPTTSNGTQLWSRVLTPASISSSFLIRFSCTISNSTNSAAVTIALFRGTTYIGSALVRGDAGADFDGIALDIMDAPATTSSVTYSCRVGASSGTWYINRRSAENTYGGTKSGWSIIEY